jgi:hypothetical protein
MQFGLNYQVEVKIIGKLVSLGAATAGSLDLFGYLDNFVIYDMHV